METNAASAKKGGAEGMSNKALRCHAKTRFTTSYGKDRKSELRFKRQSARNEVKCHLKLTDTGCLLAAVAAKRGGK